MRSSKRKQTERITLLAGQIIVYGKVVYDVLIGLFFLVRDFSIWTVSIEALFDFQSRQIQ